MSATDASRDGQLVRMTSCAQPEINRGLTAGPPATEETVIEMAVAETGVSSAKRPLSAGESILRGALANFSPQPFTWGASFLFAAFVPRFLGSQALGQLTIAFSTTTMAAVVCDVGLVEYLTRRVAQNPARVRQDIATALVVQIATFTLGAVAIAIALPVAAPNLMDYRILDMALFGMVVGCTQSVLTAALRGREQHVLFAWLGATVPVVSTLGTVLILFFGADVLAYTAMGVALSFGCIAFNWSISGLRPSRLSLRPLPLRDTWEFVRGGIPFLSWNMTMSIYNGIDRLLLGFLVPSSVIGWYAAAYRVIGIPVFIPTLLTAPLYPIISRVAHEPTTVRRAMSQTIRLALLFTVPLSAGIYALAPEVPSIFGWPSDFTGAVPLILILSAQVPLVAVDMLLGTMVMALGRERLWVRVGVVAAAVNVGFNLALIPLFDHLTGNGAIGASIVTVLTEIWMFIGAMLVIPRHTLDPRIAWAAARIIVAGVAAAAVASGLMPINLVLSAIAGACTYVGLVLLLRVLATEDVRYVSERLGRRALSMP
jgi:O-antigen/teichoic acid export membrane protein